MSDNCKKTPDSMEEIKKPSHDQEFETPVEKEEKPCCQDEIKKPNHDLPINEKIENPLNEKVASTATEKDKVKQVDHFEMNQQEKTETLREYPINEAYDGPEPKPVDEDMKDS